MKARDVVEAALDALVVRDPEAHLRWIADDVVMEAPPKTRLDGKPRYTEVITPYFWGSGGIRVKRFRIMHESDSHAEPQWVQIRLDYEVPRLNAPARSSDALELRMDWWYAVRGERIVHVKAFATDHEWRSTG